MGFETTIKVARKEERITPRLTMVREGDTEKYTFSYKIGGTRFRRTWSGAYREGLSGAEPFMFDAEFAYHLSRFYNPSENEVRKIFDILCSPEADELRTQRVCAQQAACWYIKAERACEQARLYKTDAEDAAQRAEKSASKTFIAAALAVAASLCAVLSH